MPKPIRRAPKFGAFLEKLRGELSRPYVMTQLRRYGVDIDQSTLQKAEREGRVPPLSTIRGLALVYKHPFPQMLDRLIQEESGQPVNWLAELQSMEKSETEQGKVLVTRPTVSGESASPIPEGVGSLIPNEQGGSPDVHVVVGTGATEPAPSSRQPPDLHERAHIANQLTKYAEALKRADAIRQDLYNAAAALLDDENGGHRAARTPTTPRTGGAGGRHSRRGRR